MMQIFWILLACKEPNPDVMEFGFTESERQTIAHMASTPEYALDETNQWDGNSEAIEFGEILFFSPAWSSEGFACVSCHDPELGFADGLRVSEGLEQTPRHSPSLFNLASTTWFRWDGGCDSLWCQAIGPIESAKEMGSSRADVALNLARNPALRSRYESLFGPLPDLENVVAPAKPDSNDTVTQENWLALSDTEQEELTEILVNIAKSISAYESTIRWNPSQIDAFLDIWTSDPPQALSMLTPDEEAGLRLFVGDGSCHLCHSGRDFRNDAFHNIGLPLEDGISEVDTGRYQGIDMVLASPFNAKGIWSDEPEGWKAERLDRLVQGTEQLGQFKTPSLRNLSQTAPYMHTGQYDSLEEVLAHYMLGGHSAPQGHTDETLVPLTWSQDEIDAMIAFLSMLDEHTP